MLSLSKYERALQPSSPYPSTSSGRTDWKGALRQRLSPFVPVLSEPIDDACFCACRVC
ncbi:MAG: hypothetical protein LBD67_03985 [Candidatus Accumulibacter sp.]|nr:hypothetical protein [Accumulibacter sp.]